MERESSESGATAGGANGDVTTNKVKHKIVVMGSPRTGKSSIIQQFLSNTFSPKYKRTIEEMHIGDFDVNGVHLTLEILDTSGENEFPAMRNLSISNADAFVLVYDVCDASTFEDLQAIRDQILETKGSPNVPIVVVGNKLDLAVKSREVSVPVLYFFTDWKVSNITKTPYLRCASGTPKNLLNLFAVYFLPRRVSLPITNPIKEISDKIKQIILSSGCRTFQLKVHRTQTF